ncbi:alpha/beta fold hydrolase [Streptomyces sp. NPDC006602]|uniref:alpha/beta fold hydrolase n=1 Tax=Streptomyces sp. NPDC006602 TaxID=3364751 RepID=UPI0036BCD638
MRDRLGTIVAPTLVLVGVDDFICPPRFAYELDAGIADTRLYELRRSGHFGHIEETSAFSAAVRAFIHERKTGKTA